MSDARLRGLILAVMLALFTLTVVINLRDNPLDSADTQQDEQAHLSYSYALIDQHRWWPDFNHFPMYDRLRATPLKVSVNYLNHPPTFYWLAKLAHAAIPTLTPYDYRYGALAISIASILLYGFLGFRLAMPLPATALYAVMPWLIYAHKQMGFYSNDCLAMLGGLVATYASLLWFHTQHAQRAFWLALAGLALASVKLTALMLVGLYLAACLLLKRPRHVSWQALAISAFAGALIAVPYLYLIATTGSLAPETIGQHLLMTSHPAGDNWSRVLIIGWVQEPRMHFFPWLVSFLRDFAVQVSQYDTTFIPLLLIAVTLLRGLMPAQRPISPMLKAGFIATAITLTIHAIFAWGRYQHYGWRLDSGLRYYYPLLAVYGAACGQAISSVSRPRETT